MPRTNAAAAAVPVAVPVVELGAGETGLSGWVIEAQSIGSRLLEDGPVGEGPMGEWSTEGVPIGEGPMGERPAGEGKEAGTLVAVESMLRGDISRVSVTLLACRYRCAQGGFFLFLLLLVFVLLLLLRARADCIAHSPISC